MTDFFISYTQVDRSWAEWIAWQLEAAGYTTMIQAWDFRPGTNFALAMQHAAAESARTIAVLSPAYLQSGFTAAEWAAAFTRDPTGMQGLLLPVRIHDCEPRGLLPQIVYIDLVGLETEAARERLLAGVLRQRAKPPREPGFPGSSPRPITEPPLFPSSIPQNIPLLGGARIAEREIIINLAQVGGASKFSGKIEAFFEEYLITETGLPTVPFGGRDADVALLDAWLDDETAPPRYLLTAPAGRGKSALLVRWLQHLQEQGRVGREAPVSWHLVFVPISIRFETHRPDIFYEALAARLAEILGEDLPPTQMAKDAYYADHCRTLASAASAKGGRILIVLDGIDEALGEHFDARWFPRNPGARLRLVLSARWQAGDLDSSGWQTRLGWERDVRVQSRELPVLAREGVRDLLRKMGAPTDVLATRPDIVDRLHMLAEGEPLVLRYYAEDIWGMGEAAPHLTTDDLMQMRPGLGAYFERWLDDQERLWGGTDTPVDRRRVEVLLAILACAHGRLTGADLRALLTESGEAAAGGRFLAQLKPIQRFVIGLDRPEEETAGYILSHPKLGIHLREAHFDPEYIQATQATFVRWGRKTVEQLNRGALRPEQTPAYLVQYHTQHLQDAAAPAEAFLELVEHGWLRAWETFEGGYHGFSRDMRLAYEALSRAHAADQPRFAQRLRCQLVLSSIHSIGANTPWQLLVAAFKAGVLTYRQVAHWLEFKPSADRSAALCELAPHLPAELGAEVLSEALTAARAIEDSADRAWVLIDLAPHLAAELGAEVLSEALTAARAIENSAERARALCELAPHLPAELLSEALTAARAIEDSADRAWVLGELVPHLPVELLSEALTAARAFGDSSYCARTLGKLALHLPAELGAEVLSEALTVVLALEDGSDRARALRELAPHLSAELLSEALTAARAFGDSFDRARTLSMLATYLPAELGAEVLSEALTVAQAIEDSVTRAWVLIDLAPHLPAELLSEALPAAQAIENSADRARALCELAPHLPAELGTEVLSEALTAARAIENSAERGIALRELAPYLPAELLSEALTAARALEDGSDRARTLRELAPHLPAELLSEALTAARAFGDSFYRARTLGKLATYLPAELGAEVLSEALAADRTIEDRAARARVLGELVPHLPAELLSEALTAARAVGDSAYRMNALVELAPHLPAELGAEVLSEALTAARAIEDSAERAVFLGRLAPHLPAELGAEVLSEALTAARAVGDSAYRAFFLGRLAPHLPAELGAEVLSEALTAARAFGGSFYRARALCELAPHLPAELGTEVLSEALTVARAIENSAERRIALSELAPHLPAELLSEALTAARVIGDSFYRARALSELAPHLPAELGTEVLSEALTAARAVGDSAYRMNALSELAPHLPAELGTEVLSEALTAARALEDSGARARALSELAPHLPVELLSEALTAVRAIESSGAHASALSMLVPQLSGNLLQQGFEELLDVLPRYERSSFLFVVSLFFPFLEKFQGLEGLKEVRRAIGDTARWFP